MATDRKKLSAWATEKEAATLERAAKREKRSVSQFLLLAGLDRAKKKEAA